MNGKYSLKNGSRIEIFLWEDFLQEKDWRAKSGHPCVDVREILPDGRVSPKTVHKFLKKDSKGLYINWRVKKDSAEFEKVYLNNFDHMSYLQLVNAVSDAVKANDYWAVDNDDILATFMKETDKVRILADLPVRVSPFFLGDKTKSVFCRLSEQRYDKTCWFYKISLVPEEHHPEVASSRDYYFSDFCSMLKKGIFQLV